MCCERTGRSVDQIQRLDVQSPRRRLPPINRHQGQAQRIRPVGRPRRQLSDLDSSPTRRPYLGLFGGAQVGVFVKLKNHPQMAVPVNPVQDLGRNVPRKLDAPPRAGDQSALSGSPHAFGVGRLDNSNGRQGKEVLVLRLNVDLGLLELGKCLPEFDFGTNSSRPFFLSFLFPLRTGPFVVGFQYHAANCCRHKAGGRHRQRGDQPLRLAVHVMAAHTRRLETPFAQQ